MHNFPVAASGKCIFMYINFMVFDYVCMHISVHAFMYVCMFVYYLTTSLYVVPFSHPGDFHIRLEITPLFW